jgi:hypothetical protein
MTRETYYMTKETNYMTKETYYMTKETYYMTKKTYYMMFFTGRVADKRILHIHGCYMTKESSFVI